MRSLIETQRTDLVDHERLFDEWKKSPDMIKVMKLVPNKKSFYQLIKTELGHFDKKLWLQKLHQIVQ